MSCGQTSMRGSFLTIPKKTSRIVIIWDRNIHDLFGELCPCIMITRKELTGLDNYNNYTINI